MYYLKLFNKNLISFEMSNDLGLKIFDIKILNGNKNIFPISLQNEVSEETLLNFVRSRTVPKNRAFVQNILNSAGLSINDKKGIIDVSKGLSLTDSYWIVQDENLKWEDYNLFDNDFSEILSLVAFTGYNLKIRELVTSPEFTTNGMLPKAWRRINNEVYLYKGGTDKKLFDNAGFEPYSEYYACQVENKMMVNYVKYDLVEWKGILASSCKLFTSKDYSYVQIGDLQKNGTIEDAYNLVKKYGFEEKFADMILLDSIILNYDRHFGNFGFIRENSTGKIVDFAPIFDNGESLLAMARPEIFNDKNNFEKYINEETTNISTYGVPFDRLVANFCNKNQIEKLRKLVGFSFEKHPKYNLNENRLNCLNLMIRERSNHFIDVLLNPEKYKNSINTEEPRRSEEILEINSEDYNNYNLNEKYYKYLYVDKNQKQKYIALLKENDNEIIEENFYNRQYAVDFLNNNYSSLQELHKLDEE